MTIRCSQSCVNASQFEVYGNIVYRDSSSICRAALHSGFLSPASWDRGLMLQVKQKMNVYEGSTHNGVTSIPYRASLELFDSQGNMQVLVNAQEKSFIFSPVLQKCPVDNTLLQIYRKA